MVAMWLGVELIRKWPLIFLSQEAEQCNVKPFPHLLCFGGGGVTAEFYLYSAFRSMVHLPSILNFLLITRRVWDFILAL